MNSAKNIDFYGKKPRTLPRFIYRLLHQHLQVNPAARQQAIAAALSELLTGQNPDLRKFRFFIPEFLKRSLTPAEMSHVTAQLAERRVRASRLKMVYPHVSDEFSLDADFLASIFDLDNGPAIGPAPRFVTVGSCFARNIAQYLVHYGHDAKTFELAEDLNSPMSNAFIFDLIQRTTDDQRDRLLHWMRLIYPELDEIQTRHAAESKLQDIGRFAGQLANSDCVVFTLGNIVDFFKDDADPSEPLLEKIFPKFVAMSASEDIATRSEAASRLKSKGAVLRLASHQETLEAIACCINGIRKMTSAPIVVTVSPVPIDSVIGLAKTQLRSAIEVDCVSKSRLRSAFDEIMPALRNDNVSIYYYPSFEIVRWIAPMLTIPSFGLDDGATRHVSSPILESVCSLFLNRFLKHAGGAKAAQPAEQRETPASGVKDQAIL